MPHLHRSTEAMTIDIGCGKNKIEPGSLGLDQTLDSSADVVCNLDRLPWPLRDNSASRIHLSHILEHLDDLMGVMGEVYRIAQPQAKVHVVTPHFSSHNSFSDPTHRHHLAAQSFRHFTGESFERFSGAPFRFHILDCRVSFGHNLLLDGLGRTIAGWSLPWYERHAAWIFPAQEIYCTLEVIKD